MAELPKAPGKASNDPRRSSERRLLPLGMAANLHQSNGDTVFVTLRDLSDGGVCAVRSGAVSLQEGSVVELELIDYDDGARLQVEATVRWIKPGRYSSLMGLEFLETDSGLAAFIARHRSSGGSA